MSSKCIYPTSEIWHAVKMSFWSHISFRNSIHVTMQICNCPFVEHLVHYSYYETVSKQISSEITYNNDLHSTYNQCETSHAIVMNKSQ